MSPSVPHKVQLPVHVCRKEVRSGRGQRMETAKDSPSELASFSTRAASTPAALHSHAVLSPRTDSQERPTTDFKKKQTIMKESEIARKFILRHPLTKIRPFLLQASTR